MRIREVWRRAKDLPPVAAAEEMGRLYFSCRVSRAAAGLSYFLVLTVFPALLCASAVLGWLEVDWAQVLDEAETLLPAGVPLLLEDYLGYAERSRSPALFAVGAGTAVLFVSAAVRILMHTVGEIYGYRRSRGVKQVAESVALSVLLLAGICLSAVVMVTGRWFFRGLEAVLRPGALREWLGLWQWGKYLLLFGVMFVTVAVLYRAAAPIGSRAAAGAVAASGAVVAVSGLFSAVISRSARYSLVYGSLASVIVLLVWLYLCASIVLLGSILNRVLDGRETENSR